ncbi:hypothetical protein KAR91_05175 [Candidatus Pacearchaeota archaeon]|nr:hypothetical protein [Candidatus Pacearchaeota archaeon]
MFSTASPFDVIIHDIANVLLISDSIAVFSLTITDDIATGILSIDDLIAKLESILFDIADPSPDIVDCIATSVSLMIERIANELTSC